MSDRRKRAEAIAASLSTETAEESTAEAAAPATEAEAAAEAAPAADPEKGPKLEGDAAAAPDETDYKAKYEAESKVWSAKEQEWNRAREGLIRDLQETRMRRKIAQEQAAAAQPQPSAQPGAPADSRIPIEWNEKGEAYVKPDVLARFLPQPDTSWQEHVARVERENRSLRVIAENPSLYGPMESEVAGAFQTLDLMVRRKQAERDALGLFSPLSTPDEAVAFIEDHVASEWRTLYPDLAPDKDALRDLLNYAANPRSGVAEMRKLFQGLAARRAPAGAANGHAAAAEPTAPVPSDRPRPHGERGGKAPAPVKSSVERERDELMQKDFLSYTPEERARLRELNRRLNARDRERDEQGRFQ